ncbi:MAG: hypothetical protein QNJ46_21825 [Leptolyngbyaceae cyanobacterium MO_188.B28]|nr:hypothetical protein [Leptolyngbyaceae cyanobacterium MO_188.B28]
MKSPIRRRRRSRFPRQLIDGENAPLIRWAVASLIAYSVAGLLLASFPAPNWIWNLALVGAIAQALALAGPKSLQRFGWLSANLLTLLAILGTGLMVVAIAIALNFSGAADIDQLTPAGLVRDVIKVGLGAIIIAATGAVLGAATGDRLILSFNQLQSTLILAGICVLGLGVGGLIGLAFVA